MRFEPRSRILLANAIAAICAAVVIIGWANTPDWYYKLRIPTHASVLALLVAATLTLTAVTAGYDAPSRLLVAPWVVALSLVVLNLVVHVGGDGYRYNHENCWMLSSSGADPGRVREVIACLDGSAPAQGNVYDGVFPASSENTHNRDCGTPRAGGIKRVLVWNCVRTFNQNG